MSLNLPESPEKQFDVIQPGAKGNIAMDMTGAYGASERNVAGIDSQDADTLSEAFGLTAVKEKINKQVVDGNKNVKVDLLFYPDLTDDDLKAIIALRDQLQLKGVTLTLIGLDEQEERKLRSGNVETNKLEVISKNHMIEDLKQQPASTPQ